MVENIIIYRNNYVLITTHSNVHYIVSKNDTVTWNMLSSKNKIWIKTCGNLGDFLPEDS